MKCPVVGQQAEREMFFVNADAVQDVDIDTPLVDNGSALYTYGGTDSTFASQFQHIGDFDGDGSDDFAVATDGYVVWVFLSGLSGTADYLFSITQSANGGGFFGYGMTAGDFNGDGTADLVISDAAAGGGVGHIYFYYGKSNNCMVECWT